MISALFRILLLNAKCTQIGSSLYLNQLKHQTRSNKMKGSTKIKKDTWESKRTTFLEMNKANETKVKVEMIINFTT